MASFGDYNRVNTNVTAMDAQLSLNKINRELGDSRLKLSTGFKINNAEDDAAGFAIATKLKSRVAGLEQALQNVSDAKSVLGIAEGAYNSVIDNLIEMKTLATQGANEGLGQSELGYIGEQIQALAQDINDVQSSTKYMGTNLMSAANTFTFQVGEAAADTFEVALAEINIGTLFTAGALGDAAAGGNPHDGDSNNNVDANEQHQVDAVGGATNDDAVGDALNQGGSIYLRADNDTLFIDEFSVNSDDFNDFLTDIDTAIGTMNGHLNTVGIKQRSLTGSEVNLTQAITANSAAQSRIMDTDFAKEQSNSIRLQILQQTATAALSQANMGPQAVLGFLG